MIRGLQAEKKRAAGKLFQAHCRAFLVSADHWGGPIRSVVTVCIRLSNCDRNLTNNTTLEHLHYTKIDVVKRCRSNAKRKHR